MFKPKNRRVANYLPPPPPHPFSALALSLHNSVFRQYNFRKVVYTHLDFHGHVSYCVLSLFKMTSNLSFV